ncbi:MAG TPA: hypothetical protein DCE08_06015 [Ruminococcaceae bacterium]|nr:hypothetical protein [Oscillospiraceae bacterium]
MKRFAAFLLTFLLLLPFPVFAESPRLDDGAGLLTAEEARQLEEQLDQVSKQLSFDLVIVTTDGDLDGKTLMEYADDYYDQHDYLPNGALLLVSMTERGWWVSTVGTGITSISYDDIGDISEKFLPDLSGGYYFDAFSTFISECQDYVLWGADDTSYGEDQSNGNTDYSDDHTDDSYSPFFSFDWKGTVLISLVIAFVISLISVTVMKHKLTSVRAKQEAGSYVRPGSMVLSRESDLFLYKTVSKTERPRDDNSSSGGGGGVHTSSGGVSHGGRGGSF